MSAASSLFFSTRRRCAHAAASSSEPSSLTARRLLPPRLLVSANLTSDAETGLGQWSLEQIVRALREGQAPDRALKLSYGLVETIAMKFTRPLPATTPKALTYADGNFAIDPTKGSPTSIQAILIGAQWVILVLGLILVVRARPRPKIETLDC
jgi:hypothetical protein